MSDHEFISGGLGEARSVLPAAVRKGIYIGAVVVAIALGALQVGFAAADVAQPVWFDVALNVLAYLSLPVSILAAGNVNPGALPSAEPGGTEP